MPGAVAGFEDAIMPCLACKAAWKMGHLSGAGSSQLVGSIFVPRHPTCGWIYPVKLEETCLSSPVDGAFGYREVGKDLHLLLGLIA
jgi:hypothetical protein